MSNNNRGPWIQTYTGKRFHFFDVRPEDISIEDIARSLSKLCRFTGHTRDFYSVAQHSILVAAQLPQDFRLYGLLHDAAEAYIGDINRPLKHYLNAVIDGTTVSQLEDSIMRVIYAAFDIPQPTGTIKQLVKEADERMLTTERRDLLSHQRDDRTHPPPYHFKITPLEPTGAYLNFMGNYELCSI